MNNKQKMDDFEKKFNAEALEYRIIERDTGYDITDTMTEKDRIGTYCCWLASCPDVEHLELVKDDK